MHMLASWMSYYQKMAVMSFCSCSHHAIYKNNLIAVQLYHSKKGTLVQSKQLPPGIFIGLSNVVQFCSNF